MSISAAEVKKHRTKNSCWMVINNDVYDVTAFLNEHPGGEDALLKYGGKDGTQAFEDVGHSPDARELMKKFKIGSLHPQERKFYVDPCCQAAVSKNPSCAGVKRLVESKSDSSWRTYDGSARDSQYVTPKSSFKGVPSITSCGRVNAIVVPRESNKWKWIMLALAAAIIAGVAARRYYAPG